ncbi:6,7-dimethyl-8-ribityllumazine synthase [Aestuariivirga litoralis]|uniref:6,7-dimethyl-8-ribityllumazine synthase n=1 Tax=Aestuariivirga litoralis TaxID=2650924 RepID=UPI001FEF7769|nr:6,7-dimethyl-8-ribityllumazine synthase [Aestuariivirga litoralis]MBG1232084.1 6,7-dimethyl-8-ribityllumazine synthase [Aestuariivirga litoralis]
MELKIMRTIPETKSTWRIAVITSRFNEEVTGGLKKGAIAALAEHGITVKPEDVFPAPGAFELPLLAQSLARSGRYQGVICLGCVIKGETAHFEFISLGGTIGTMLAMLATETPIAFGIITTYNDDQAISRSREDHHNKGREAALACVETLETLQKMRL